MSGAAGTGAWPDFGGAKLAVLSGDRVLVMLRDDRVDIPFPGHWDLPGGGREGDESPADCALRETQEELGLILPESALHWRRDYARTNGAPGRTWMFVTRDDGLDRTRIVLGDEGQRWEMMPVAEFLTHPLAVPHLASRLAEYFSQSDARADLAVRVACRSPAAGRDGVTRIPAWKFAALRREILAVIDDGPDQGVGFTGLDDAVRKRLSAENRARMGSVGWHVTTVKLELEVRGEIARDDIAGRQVLRRG